jgi:hypothetical protein
MVLERQRIFRLIQQKAAAGDEVHQFLAQEFTSPKQLLGGDQDDEPGPTP